MPSPLLDHRYRLLSLVGEDAVARLHRAEDAVTSALVGLARLADSSPPGAAEIHRREFELLSSFHHPNIPAALDYGICPQSGPYFTTEDIGPHTLAALSSPVTLSQAVSILLGGLRALEYIHERRISHGALSPRALTVAPIPSGAPSRTHASRSEPTLLPSQVRLVGFHHAAASQSRQPPGDPAFLAPEVSRGAPHTLGSDLYALGLTVLSLVRPRNQGASAESDPMAFLGAESPFADPKGSFLRQVLGRFLSPDPKERLQERHALLAQLCQLAPPSGPQEVRRSLSISLGGILPRSATRLVEQVRQSLAEAASGPRDLPPQSPRLFLLAGEAGTPWSRILRGIRIQAQLHHVALATITCNPLGLDPLDSLKKIAEADDGSSDDPYARRGPPHAQQTAPRWYASYLPCGRGSCRGPRSINAPNPAHDNLRLEALHALAARVHSFCRHTPALILMTDLHHADLETLELIRLLQAHPHPPLLVGCSESGHPGHAQLEPLHDFFAGRPHALSATIEGFAEDETDLLLKSLCARAPASSRIGRLLHGLTGGNPLLLEQTLLHLLEEGAVSQTPEGWRIDAGRILSSDLPNNLRGFAESQLAKASPSSRSLLEVIAAHGAPIDLALLASTARRLPAEVLEALGPLLRSGLLKQEGGTSRPLYGYRHGCLRELVYHAIPPSRRREIHRLMAVQLEHADPSRREQLLEQLAHHYLEATDQEKGPAFAFQAAYYALDRFATKRATELLIRGLNLTPANDLGRRFEGLELIPTLLAMSGDLVRARSYYQEMLLLARAHNVPDKEAIAIRELAELLVENGEIVRGLAYARDAEERFQRLGDPVGEARALGIQAQAQRKAGERTIAEELAGRGFSTARASGDVYVQSLTRSIQGLLAIDRGDYREAIGLMEEALRLKVQINDVGGVALTLNNIGLAFLEHGLLPEAEPYFERSLVEARSKGLSLAAILASINLGEIRRLRGALDQADVLGREALALADGSGRKQFAAYCSYSLGFIALLKGAFREARAQLCEAQELLDTAGARSDLVLVLVCNAELARLLGRSEESQTWARRSLQMAREVGNPQTLAFARAVASLAGLTAEEGESAQLLSQANFEAARRTGRTHALMRFMEARASFLLSAGRAEEALRALQEMKSCAQEAGLRPDLVRAGLLEGQALLQVQRRVEARLVLEEAAVKGREMGLRPLLSHVLYWLAQAQEAAGDAAAAADSVFEGADLVGEMAAGIAEDDLRQSYAAAPLSLALVQHADRLLRAGLRPRARAGQRAFDPEEAASRLFEEAGRQLGPGAPLRALLTAVLDGAIEAVRADRGLLILLDPPSAQVTIARNMEGGVLADASDYCRAILEEAARGEPILAIDVAADERFKGRMPAGPHGIVSLLCAPLRLGEKVLGAIYFDSRSGERLFRHEDLRLIEACATRAAAAIEEARETQREREQAVVLNRALARRYHMANLIGESGPMKRLVGMMEAVTRADCNVLVVGESGTGKELVARAIHFGGPRRLCNFVPLDCGAVPENLIESELFGYRRGAFSGAEADKKGLLEEADGGTLFLDEVTNTTPAFQAKLLRALQSGEFRRLGETLTRRVDVRIIAATNADVDTAIRDGRFREDLYYRLNVVTLTLPPLRERREDIPALAEHFARRFCEARRSPFRGIGRAALARLVAHAWPGNIRELENAVEAALVVSGDGMVHREALPEKVRGGDVEQVIDLLREEQAAGSGSWNGRHEEQAAGPGSWSGPREADIDAGGDAHGRDAHGRDGGDAGEALPERARIEEALRRTAGDKSRAARLLGWSRMRLYRRMKRLGIPYGNGGAAASAAFVAQDPRAAHDPGDDDLDTPLPPGV